MAAADPQKTQQWEGHQKHQRHLKEQEAERKIRRAIRIEKRNKT